jgi:hypothetical protein
MFIYRNVNFCWVMFSAINLGLLGSTQLLLFLDFLKFYPLGVLVLSGSFASTGSCCISFSSNELAE